MTSSTMRPPTSTKELAADLKASERHVKRVTKTKAAARAFLQRAGFLDKKGKLAKQYRV